jgi:hypothetical protein
MTAAKNPHAKTPTTMQQRAIDKRRRAYDLRAEGKSWDEVGAAMGLAPASCQKLYNTAVRTDGLPRLTEISRADVDQTSLVARDPAAAAEVVVAMTESALLNENDARFKALREACKEAGMKPGLVTALIKRMLSRGAGVLQEVRRLTLPELTAELERKTSLVMSYIDEYSVSQAGLKDLAIAANILIEKHQLLTNKPTQIIDFTARQQLGVLMPMMLAEAKRRGFDIQGTATRVETTP